MPSNSTNKCPECKGSGSAKDNTPGGYGDCPICKGTGIAQSSTDSPETYSTGETYISDCCDAPVEVAGRYTTHHWVCTLCHEACDANKLFKGAEFATFKPTPRPQENGTAEADASELPHHPGPKPTREQVKASLEAAASTFDDGELYKLLREIRVNASSDGRDGIKYEDEQAAFLAWSARQNARYAIAVLETARDQHSATCKARTKDVVDCVWDQVIYSTITELKGKL
jgi:hypothetical protein